MFVFLADFLFYNHFSFSTGVIVFFMSLFFLSQMMGFREDFSPLFFRYLRRQLETFLFLVIDERQSLRTSVGKKILLQLLAVGYPIIFSFRWLVEPNFVRIVLNKARIGWMYFYERDTMQVFSAVLYHRKVARRAFSIILSRLAGCRRRNEVVGYISSRSVEIYGHNCGEKIENIDCFWYADLVSASESTKFNLYVSSELCCRRNCLELYRGLRAVLFLSSYIKLGGLISRTCFRLLVCSI